ncbi:Lysophospholipase [Serinicoccus hydrothermalis]|uniref:Lysophospholipase n=1 Tax=Serinicoccus hydrothermalis TaxID=1758689 RepID=A0A1B1N976_9MICO|nr:alpha/beta hydrolase [Serinicoccus hydrothermalis]ANS77935.1 Lysophospholipase [Serinicoccus hydrothermalis]
MSDSTFVLSTPDGSQVHLTTWLPEGAPRAVVLVAHGMVEHAARYEHLARRLLDHGYAVYAPDHRGHGHTVSGRGERGLLGHMADQDGFASVVDDLLALTDRIEADLPGVPVVLLGHSMGSFLARAYAARYGDRLAALILSGTAGAPGVLANLGLGVASLEARLRGPRAPSHLMTTLTMGPYNARFRPNRTRSDWLSRDTAQVDAYEADPLSGATASAGFYRDLLTGLRWVSQRSVAAQMPKELPVHLVAGEVDPVGGEAGTEEVAALFRDVGMQDVTTRIWPGARHEVLQEVNRDEVETELLAWLDAHVPTSTP